MEESEHSTAQSTIDLHEFETDLQLIGNVLLTMRGW